VHQSADVNERATLVPGTSLGIWLAHDLGHQPERVPSEAEEVPVAPMVENHVVIIVDDRHCIGLPADARTCGAVEQVALETVGARSRRNGG
jgi:hypothetical protein